MNSMSDILLGMLYVIVLILLVIVMGVHPQASSHSKFELRRRARRGDQDAQHLLKRHALMRDIFSLQRVIAAVLLVTLSVIGVELFHWLLGIIISLVIALEIGALARISLWQQYSQRLYERYEGRILALIEKFPTLFAMIRSVAPMPNDGYDIESKEELVAMVEQAGEALSRDEKKMVIGVLSFDAVPVKEVMTPRSVIDTVDQDEVLGPLVLDALHKTGHSRFPVTKGDIDHVVGMLYIQDLLTINRSSTSKQARTVMEKKVYYIREDQTLQHALAAFLRVRHHLFIVVNEFRETVGIVSLEDVIERILGHKIIDEFDAHEDLRRVAQRNPRHNNRTKHARDVA